MSIKMLEVVELAKSYGAVVGVKHILDTDKEMVHFTPKELVDFFDGAKKQGRDGLVRHPLPSQANKEGGGSMAFTVCEVVLIAVGSCIVGIIVQMLWKWVEK